MYLSSLCSMLHTRFIKKVNYHRGQVTHKHFLAIIIKDTIFRAKKKL